MPYSIQVHQNHSEASLEAGTSDVLSGCGWLVELDHWPETLSKDPNHVFKFPRGKISNINISISIRTANFVLHKMKHQFWVFSQSLRVSGRPQVTSEDVSTLGVFVVDMDAEGDTFVANSLSKPAEN